MPACICIRPASEFEGNVVNNPQGQSAANAAQQIHRADLRPGIESFVSAHSSFHCHRTGRPTPRTGHEKQSSRRDLVGSRAPRSGPSRLIVTYPTPPESLRWARSLFMHRDTSFPSSSYSWLSLFWGFTIAALGCYMALRRLTGTATEEAHSHLPGKSHDHWSFFKRSQSVDQPKNAIAAAASQRPCLLRSFLPGIAAVTNCRRADRAPQRRHAAPHRAGLLSHRCL